jgi:hypothetical protein
MKSKRELREIGKKALENAMAKAGCEIYENILGHDLTEDEKDIANEYLNKCHKSVCKRLGLNYYTV